MIPKSEKSQKPKEKLKKLKKLKKFKKLKKLRSRNLPGFKVSMSEVSLLTSSNLDLYSVWGHW